jgi:hypothetical protein
MIIINALYLSSTHPQHIVFRQWSCMFFIQNKKPRYNFIQIPNSVALVREQTILTERPPLVGEVSANFCG